jgi:hypothetical protein
MADATAPWNVEIRCPECAGLMREFAHAPGEFTVLCCTVCATTFRLDANCASQTSGSEIARLHHAPSGTLLEFPPARRTRAS